MMSYEDYQRIWEDFCSKETIQTPVGLMVGKPTLPGSKIPFSDYTMTLEDGPFKGETVTITGLGGGHGTLFFNTEKGKTAVKIDYDQPKVEYADEDPEECPCAEEDDEYEPADPVHDAIKLPRESDGFRVAKDFAVRAAEWFNGGHPKTLVMPISVMKNGKIVDTEHIPLNLQNRDVWRSIEFKVLNMCIHDGKATVTLAYDTEKKNSGCHAMEMSDVQSVEYRDGKLTITGRYGDSEPKTMEMEVIDKPEVKGKHAPKWYLEEMARSIEEIRPDGSAQAKILGNRLNWLHPIALQTPKRTVRQFCLEEFA